MLKNVKKSDEISGNSCANSAKCGKIGNSREAMLAEAFSLISSMNDEQVAVLLEMFKEEFA